MALRHAAGDLSGRQAGPMAASWYKIFRNLNQMADHHNFLMAFI